MSHSDIQQIESEETRYKIFELRKAGWSHAQIAYALNCTRHHISQLLRKELETTRTLADAALDDLRTLELARLDEATKSIWPRVLNADTRAIDIFLKISERRAKLTGMDAPERTLSIDLTQQLERLSPTDLLQEATRLGLPLPTNHIALLPISLPGEQSSHFEASPLVVQEKTADGPSGYAPQADGPSAQEEIPADDNAAAAADSQQ